jgi:hypothetical protein
MYMDVGGVEEASVDTSVDVPDIDKGGVVGVSTGVGGMGLLASAWL